MKSEDIVRMANQIAAFFSAYPQEEAVAGIADHIRKFWEPRMKADLQALVEAPPDTLDPLVIKAARSLRSPA